MIDKIYMTAALLASLFCAAPAMAGDIARTGERTALKLVPGDNDIKLREATVELRVNRFDEDWDDPNCERTSVAQFAPYQHRVGKVVFEEKPGELRITSPSSRPINIALDNGGEWPPVLFDENGRLAIGNALVDSATGKVLAKEPQGTINLRRRPEHRNHPRRLCLAPQWRALRLVAIRTGTFPRQVAIRLSALAACPDHAVRYRRGDADAARPDRPRRKQPRIRDQENRHWQMQGRPSAIAGGPGLFDRTGLN